LERAGFEVHKVENNGVHYSLTILAWYHNWVANKQAVVEKYGMWWWRNWAIFLTWSHLIAAQGSSTVYMITMTKNLVNDKSSRAYPDNGFIPNIDRTDKWVKIEGDLRKKNILC